jgi:biotin carboxyl carrier protein
MSILKREIVVEGKPYRVEVKECSLGTPFSIKLNDAPFDVALEKEPDYKKPFMIKIRGKTYVVELSKIDRRMPFSIKINDVPLRVELKLTAMKLVQPLSPTAMMVQKPSKKTFAEGVVIAPMAGKIISVKVKKGDSVKVGDVLCTLEAMKMENEITAPKNGKVEEVLAREGQAVNEGDVLATIK